MKLKKDKLVPGGLAVEESLFHVANGYLGVRGNFEEGYPEGVDTIRGCYVNGFYDTVGITYPEKLYGFPEQIQRMVNLPDIQTMRLSVEGEAFSPFAGNLREYTRELDTHEGISRRRMLWESPEGRIVRADIRRMASFACPNLFLTVYEISLPKGGEICLAGGVDCAVSNYANPADPRVAAEGQRHVFPDRVRLLEDGGLVEFHTGASGLRMAICQRWAAGPATTEVIAEEEGFSVQLKRKLAPGESLSVAKYTLICDSRRSENPAADALALAAECAGKGPERLFLEQREYLASFWRRGEVFVDGDDELRESLQYSQYMLLQSAGRDSVGNVSAQGLSGEGYEGHYFWDTEIYILPFFALTQPELAKRLLDCRYGMLDKAREHARVMGHGRGALYPWRTITGSECSTYFPSGSAQYHISGDIAYSFMQYYYLTGDLGFMADKGCEVLIETARMWLEIGGYGRDGRFCIHAVTGPDEYTCIVNNNYYTNLIARHNLLAAAEICRELEARGLQIAAKERVALAPGETEAFIRAAEAMYLPYDEKLGVYAQDDSFLSKPVWDFEATPKENYPLLLHYHPLALYRHQVCKQADTVLAHFLFEDDADEEAMRNSFRYYERVTTHDSSLSLCVFSMMAARLGELDKAYRYFAKAVRTDLDNAHGNTKDGIHTANMGGSYLGLVAGFAGLRVKKDGLHFRFALPKQWRGYAFHVRFKGSLLWVDVRVDSTVIKLVEGLPVTVTADGVRHEINGIVELPRCDS
jgi:alpha,alpha-trehalose phosphorylase